jgi:uncharacterized protein
MIARDSPSTHRLHASGRARAPLEWPFALVVCSLATASCRSVGPESSSDGAGTTTSPAAAPPFASSMPTQPEASTSAPMSPSADADHEHIARAFVAELSRGDFPAAAGRFDATMSAALPSSALEQTWKGLQQGVGAFEAAGGARKEKEGAYEVVRLRCEFERATLEAKLAFDGERRIAGLFFTPPTAEYSLPSYAKPERIEEREVAVGSGAWILPGTLVLPRGVAKAPAIVLVHGSGPNDRDESVGANKPFRDLAHGLGALGIATLRYDKRTKVHGAKLATDLSLTVNEETVHDAVLAVTLLRSMPEIDPARVFVAGHSLGGMLAPRIAERAPELRGIVVLAGNTRAVYDMVPEQLAYIASLDGRTTEDENAQLAEVKRVAERIRALEAGAAPNPGERLLGAGAAYWKDLAGYDPPARARALGKPVFVAQGGRDYQVTKVDFEAWKKALDGRPGAKLVLYPELNHLLGSGTGPSHPQEYEQRAEVDATLVRDLSLFIDGLK